MTRRIWTGLTVAFAGLLGGVLGWTISIETVQSVIRYPGCNGSAAEFSICHAAVRNITGLHMVGIMGSIFGGIVVIAVGTIIACTKPARTR